MDIKLAKHFWTKVIVSVDEDACWLWKAGLDKDGYGQFWIPELKKCIPAQRFSFVASKDRSLESIKGKLICHTCDNPSCVNPDHLFEGTALDNARDMIEKGRQNYSSSGESNYAGHKLIAEQIIEIRSLYAQGDHTWHSLAAIYGVHPGTIGKIINRKKWKHI